MPARAVLARELAELMKVVAHPDRVRLIEELRHGGLDVTALSDRLAIPAARASQHLALLKAHRLVAERRDGRHHEYSLIDRALAGWLLDGARFVQSRAASEAVDREALETAARLWRDGAPATGAGPANTHANTNASRGDHHG